MTNRNIPNIGGCNVAAVTTGPRPHQLSNKARVAEEQVKCYELLLAGKTYREIAAEVGVSLATVSRRIDAERDARVRPAAEAVRLMEVDRLTRYVTVLDAEIQKGGPKAPRAIEVAVKVSERLAKLQGLDAATQVEAVVHQVDSTDLAISELIREAQAAAAAEEAKLREGTI